MAEAKPYSFRKGRGWKDTKKTGKHNMKKKIAELDEGSKKANKLSED